jgi:lipoate-protein ligase A
MALDFLLLQRYPGDAARFRHYSWRNPSATFGYSQKIAFVREQLGSGPRLDLCRRPTGGGIVDHREDWTYTLVVPRGHPLEDLRATQSYREVHACIAEALRAQGVAASLMGEPGTAPPGICFQRAEIHDVIGGPNGAKIAGAAQKRNKRGLLFQGSIWRPAAGPGVDWDRFERDFGSGLASILGVEPVEAPWPELDEDEVSGLIENYSSPEWIEAR